MSWEEGGVRYCTFYFLLSSSNGPFSWPKSHEKRVTFWNFTLRSCRYDIAILHVYFFLLAEQIFCSISFSRNLVHNFPHSLLFSLSTSHIWNLETYTLVQMIFYRKWGKNYSKQTKDEVSLMNKILYHIILYFVGRNQTSSSLPTSHIWNPSTHILCTWPLKEKLARIRAKIRQVWDQSQ